MRGMGADTTREALSLFQEKKARPPCQQRLVREGEAVEWRVMAGMERP